MGLWTIQGGNPLYGTVQVQGSVNSAMVLLAASLLNRGITVLHRVPHVTDVEEMLRLLRCAGCKIKREGERVTVDASMAKPMLAAESSLRSSVLLLGSMAGRFGEAMIPMPQSEFQGPRPVDLHLDVLRQLGYEIRLEDGALGCVRGKAAEREVHLAYPSVGATENAMLAACGCGGETVLRGCAREPEITQLAEFLRMAGVAVTGDGTDTICVKGTFASGTREMKLMPDRNAGAWLLCAAAACGGEICLQEVNCAHLQPILDGLEEMGCNIKIRDHSVTLRSQGRLWAGNRAVVTGPWPGFPTDLLPSYLAVCLKADGVSCGEDRVYGDRLQCVELLRRFGGDVTRVGDCAALVTGVPCLQGANVIARAPWMAAAAVIAGLSACGETALVDNGSLDRIFAYPECTLRQLGAEIE